MKDANSNTSIASWAIRFAASQLVTITTVISTGIMLFVLLFNKPTLSILFGSVDEDVMTAAIIYFVIS